MTTSKRIRTITGPDGQASTKTELVVTTPTPTDGGSSDTPTNTTTSGGGSLQTGSAAVDLSARFQVVAAAAAIAGVYLL